MIASTIVLFAMLALTGAPGATGPGPQSSDGAAAAAAVGQPAPPEPDAAQVASHKRVLEKTIADLKAGKTDYASMAPELAAKVRASESAITSSLQHMGSLQTVEFAGLQQGALKFRVVFEQAATTWFISLGPDGKIVFLVLRAG